MPKVLLVNTQPHLRLLLEKRFEKEGFEVQVSSWEETLNASGVQAPDLIVLGQDAEHPSSQWFAKNGARPAPVILLTTGDAGEALAAPAQKDVAHLRMPFRPSQLVALARKAVAAS